MTVGTKARYHFDQVGSYLRPAALKQARADYAAGTIDHETLIQVQHDEIHDLVVHQHEVGLKDVTDGEFARSWWHLDFLWALPVLSATHRKIHTNSTAKKRERITSN